ncbi:polyprenyl synthetase family protein [candidate division KSB1 bacterium]|nr:polyprenyl synthetase family protein [candidate division KSB1 bacterium]
MTLQKIRSVVSKEMRRFNKEFENTLKSNIFIVDRVIKYGFLRRGKRIRPTLTLLCSHLCGGVNENSFRVAIIAELLHTATLIHDDVVDESQVRRGMPSVNARWKNKVSVLLGDYILSKCLAAMLDVRDFRVFEILSQAARRMSQGELNQIMGNRRLDLSEEAYLNMISDKTAALISASCELGGAVVVADDDRCLGLKKYGECLGMAYQIRDDILDLIGTKEKMGKPVGSDLGNNGLTLPLIHAMSEARPKERSRVLGWLKKGTDGSRREEIVAWVKEKGGIQYATEKSQQYAGQAISHLSDCPDSPYKKALENFVTFAITRHG